MKTESKSRLFKRPAPLPVGEGVRHYFFGSCKNLNVPLLQERLGEVDCVNGIRVKRNQNT